jgi:hypothetical protein
MRKGCTNYIWKAETQDNGNIHFHITGNHYIFWRSIRNKWNSLQSRYGYLKKYFTEHDTMDANSTDVHAVKNTKSIIAYMTKYLIKSDKFKKNQSKIYKAPSHYYHDKLNERDPQGRLIKRFIECALWSCSQELSKKKLNISEVDDGFNGVIKYISENSKSETMEHGTLFKYNSEIIFANAFRMIDEVEYYDTLKPVETFLTDTGIAQTKRHSEY